MKNSYNLFYEKVCVCHSTYSMDLKNAPQDHFLYCVTKPFLAVRKRYPNKIDSHHSCPQALSLEKLSSAPKSLNVRF